MGPQVSWEAPGSLPLPTRSTAGPVGLVIRSLRADTSVTKDEGSETPGHTNSLPVVCERR